jgi:hypothetical protein
LALPSRHAHTPGTGPRLAQQIEDARVRISTIAGRAGLFTTAIYRVFEYVSGTSAAAPRYGYGHPTEPHNEGSVQLTCGLGVSNSTPQKLGRTKHGAVPGDGAQVLSMQEGVMM